MTPGFGADRPSLTAFAATFGGATIAAQVAQVIWLATASRTMVAPDFGRVLAAQALYALLQVVVDVGSTYHGARLAAAGLLEDAGRGEIVRIRLALSAGAAVVLMLVGAAESARLVLATTPFAFAIVLFAVLNYWERFGLGDGRPLSSYVLGRAIVPAALASAFLAAGATFPLPLAGIGESALIVLIAVAFRLRPLHGVRLALGARMMPWRSVVGVGLPFAAGQLNLAAGTILLTAAGAGAAAAAFAVATRLLTGVNQLAGVVATSLFPRLARVAAQAESGATIAIGLRVVVLACAAATSVLLVDPALFVRLFLARAGGDAVATTIVTVSASAAASVLMLVTTILIARRGESVLAPISGIGSALAVGGAVVVVVVMPTHPSTATAAALVVSQLVMLGLIVWRRGPAFADERRSLGLAATASFVLAGAGALAALVPSARLTVAACCGLLAVALLVNVGLVLRGRGRLDRAASPR